MQHISRRRFGAIVAAGVVGGRLAPSAYGQGGPAAVTVGEIVARIRAGVGVPWRAETVDTVKAGDPATVVTGVATTAMATLDVLRRAVASGANLVFTSEPTFFARADARTPPVRPGPPGTAPPAPRTDPVYDAKNRFIEDHGLVVFRLSEHWRARAPDPFVQGFADAMGWGRLPGDPPRYGASGTLETLAGQIKRGLGVRGGMRAVGDPGIPVRSVAILPGSTPLAATLGALPSVDAVVAGEVREWESVEYARDVAHSGQPKGLILLGRVVSQEPGMMACAEWLGTIVPEVPVRHLAAGDPYWRAG